jgi:hypothetical protein
VSDIYVNFFVVGKGFTSLCSIKSHKTGTFGAFDPQSQFVCTITRIYELGQWQGLVYKSRQMGKFVRISYIKQGQGEDGLYWDGLPDGRPGSIPGRSKTYSPLRSVQTGSKSRPASYPKSTWGFFLESKATDVRN